MTSYYGLSAAATELSSNFGSMVAAGPGGTLAQSAANNTGNLDGFYDNIAFTGNFTAHGSMPPVTFSGWVMNNTVLQSTTIPGGIWETKLSIHCSDSGAPVGILTIRWWKFNWTTNVFTAIGSASSTSTTLASGWNDFDLSASGISPVSFAAGNEFTGDTLYVDFIWEQTAGGDGATNTALGVSSTATGVAGGSSTHGMEVIVPASGGSEVDGAATIGGVGGIAASGVMQSSATLGGIGGLQASTQPVGVAKIGGIGGLNATPVITATAVIGGAGGVLNTFNLNPLPTIPPPVMPLISQGLPTYASDISYPPSNATDAFYATVWNSARTPSVGSPCWLAIDLSTVPSIQRGSIVVNLLNEGGNIWYDPSGSSKQNLFANYEIDGNTAAGGGSSAPASGWVTLATVSNNTYSTRQHILNFAGYNWLRILVTAVDGPPLNNNLVMQVDVHDAHLGIADRWLFSGDSITNESMLHANFLAGGDWGPAIPGPLSKVVYNDTYQTYYPAVIDGGWSGQTAAGAAANVNGVLAGFSGGFVILAYGTNDVNQAFLFSPGDSNVIAVYNNMKVLINAALALNNVVIVPKIPDMGPDNVDGGLNANLVNEYMAANLPTDYPANFGATLFIGPDFWTYFQQNQQLIRNDGGITIHPTFIEVNGLPCGYEEMHSLYASWMTQFVYQVTARPAVLTLSDSLEVMYMLSDSITR